MRPFNLPLIGGARFRGDPLNKSVPEPSPPVLEEIDNFGNNPGALRMFAYAPPSLPANAPLVVLLHGCGQTAAAYSRGTGWAELANQLGFAVLAPEQTRLNNPNNCFNWFNPADTARGHGEATSIRAMIDWAVVRYHADRSRIFITGLSAGGAMTAAMLAAYPDVFAGGAIIAGLPGGVASTVPEALNSMQHSPERSAEQWGNLVREASMHTGPWPRISIWYGSADTIVHRSNGEALVAQWSDVHDLTLSEAETEFVGPHKRSTWRTNKGDVVMEAFELAQMGHGVPVGGPIGQQYGETGAFFLDKGISSTVHIAYFWGFPIAPTKNGDEVRSAEAPHGPNGFRRNVGHVISNALKSAGLLKG